MRGREAFLRVRNIRKGRLRRCSVAVIAKCEAVFYLTIRLSDSTVQLISCTVESRLVYWSVDEAAQESIARATVSTPASQSIATSLEWGRGGDSCSQSPAKIPLSNRAQKCRAGSHRTSKAVTQHAQMIIGAQLEKAVASTCAKRDICYNDCITVLEGRHLFEHCCLWSTLRVVSAVQGVRVLSP
ncbi:hypothetical protein HYPSUDRAFT_38809 [Hypholoma sublateritium FD-334 SS-4]|uniref:Uncharacterized protein n=1 Tax=Hypholoma sublateritium (strain FD-334 SS-4) TaxID=945553 RepID=A0A0D2PY82_HYPSF|nr:hypothetical protein HYPSUDRAFT_38809 [Hypholoma sublateritium FD-334 SS-4]